MRKIFKGILNPHFLPATYRRSSKIFASKNGCGLDHKRCSYLTTATGKASESDVHRAFLASHSFFESIHSKLREYSPFLVCALEMYDGDSSVRTRDRRPSRIVKPRADADDFIDDTPPEVLAAEAAARSRRPAGKRVPESLRHMDEYRQVFSQADKSWVPRPQKKARILSSPRADSTCGGR